MVLMGMELPLSAIRSQIASGIDILIHLGRLRDKSRKVLKIAEIAGMEQGEVMLHELFRILHHNSPPFFPVGGYYNKRPCRHKTA